MCIYACLAMCVTVHKWCICDRQTQLRYGSTSCHIYISLFPRVQLCGLTWSSTMNPHAISTSHSIKTLVSEDGKLVHDWLDGWVKMYLWYMYIEQFLQAAAYAFTYLNRVTCQTLPNKFWYWFLQVAFTVCIRNCLRSSGFSFFL